MSFPYNRNRRLRTSENIRKLVQENQLKVTDFIVPLFIAEGKGVQEEIPSMPDYFRFSLDLAIEEVLKLQDLGFVAVLLFAKVPAKLKDNKGTEALNPKGLMQRAVRSIKKAAPNMVVITDVALDPYSIFGHDGIVENKQIINDKTSRVLGQMALSHIEAGADIVSPSDMMDGRVKIIRECFEENKLEHAGILSYTAKYASGFYGPFRDALDSAPGFGDKKTYQMDYHNSKEALLEAQLDVEEGADMLIVKPGIAYLDIVKELSSQLNVPIVSYQVSGEYAMVKAAAAKGWIDLDSVVYEQLIAFKRAGASMIISYFAKDSVNFFS